MASYSHLIGFHEGRELALMLAGSKPLSLFYFESAERESVEFPEAEFDEQVSLGRLAKRTTQKIVMSPRELPIEITTVIYSLADQTWRIDAYLFVAELYQSFGPGYRPDLERVIGNLLGYTSDEIEGFIGHLRAKGSYLAYG